MQWYWLTLAAVLVPACHGYTAGKPYPTFAKCDQNVVSAITTHWRTVGTPNNVPQKIEQEGLFSVYHTSYDYLNSDNKCIYAKIKEGALNITFVPKQGDVSASLLYNVQQGDDGIIKTTPLKNDAQSFKWYPITYDNGVVVCYACSDVEGSPQLPVFTIMVTNKNKSLLSNAVVNSGIAFLKGLGVTFKYNYGQECNLTE